MSGVYSCHLRAANGTDMARIARRVSRARFAWDKHGCADGSILLNSPTRDLYTAYTRSGSPILAFAAHGGDIWRGRLQSPRIGSRAIELVAAGSWQALGDVPYTALWSDTRVSEWVQTTPEQVATRTPDLYQMDTNNRLWITATKGTTYAVNNDGELHYMIPSESARQIQTVTFDYSFNMSANFSARLAGFQDGFTSGANEWTLNGTGAVQSGTTTITMSTPRDIVTFYVRCTTGHTFAGETGTASLRITNIRIKTTTAANVVASDIAASLASVTNTANPGQLASTGARVQATGTDLRDEIFEDVYPSEILDDLALRSGYQAWVDLQQQLVFEPLRQNARTWLIEVSDFQIERALDRVRNQRYATYQDASGRTLRTAAASDLPSYWRNGLTRSAPVNVRSTSSTQATTQRDTALDDTEDPSPRASFTIRRLLNSVNGPVPLHSPRPGDTALITNLPASLPERDQVRAWTIGRVEVELTQGQPAKLTLEPDAPTPKLVALLAKLEKQ